jgi:ligand-binding sensor domain-containing protein
MKIKIAYILLVSVLPCFQVAAQKPDIRFENLRTEQGASQNTISFITRDRYGYIWFATDDGLNKYDGYKITRYRTNAKDPRSIGNNVVNCILEDSKGRLWIGVDQGGLNLYDRNTNSFIRFLYNDTVPSSLRDNTVRAMCEDAEGNLWIGTNTGLDIMSTVGKFRHFSMRSSSNITISEQINCLFTDKQKKLWVGTGNGLAVFNSVNQNFKIYTHDDNNPNAITKGWISALAEDDEGNLWIGTDAGINVKKKNENRFVHLSRNEKSINSLAHNFIWALANEGNGRMWIGTEGGLNIYELEWQNVDWYRGRIEYLRTCKPAVFYL